MLPLPLWPPAHRVCPAPWPLQAKDYKSKEGSLNEQLIAKYGYDLRYGLGGVMLQWYKSPGDDTPTNVLTLRDDTVVKMSTETHSGPKPPHLFAHALCGEGSDAGRASTTTLLLEFSPQLRPVSLAVGRLNHRTRLCGNRPLVGFHHHRLRQDQDR